MKRKMHDTKWTFSTNTQPFEYDTSKIAEETNV